MREEDVVALFIVATAVTICVVTWARLWFRRQERRDRAPELGASHVEHRLERIEQAVDAIAIEVERLAEGQRFATRLLSESRAPESLPADPNRR